MPGDTILAMLQRFIHVPMPLVLVLPVQHSFVEPTDYVPYDNKMISIIMLFLVLLTVHGW